MKTRLQQNIKIYALTLGLIGLVPTTAFADDSSASLFIEPAVTYELGTTAISYPAPISNSTGTVTGFGLGARLGFHLQEVFFIGVDGRYSMTNFKDSSVTYDEKAVSTNWGPVVGLQMPIVGLRVWGSYILDGILDPEISGNFDVKFTNASGYRVGAGFRLTAISINLEYQQISYGHTILEQIGPFASGTSLENVELENKAWLASISFPLEL